MAGFKISHLYKDLRTVTLPDPTDPTAEPLSVTYRPSGITPESSAGAARVKSLSDAGDEAQANQNAVVWLAEYLSSVVVSWNLTGDDGAPVDHKNCSKLGMDVLSALMSLVQEDAKGSDDTATGSSGKSSASLSAG